MASETETQANVRTRLARPPWQAGIVGGLLGGVVFGVMMTMEMRMVMEMAIPGMYGLSESLELGWLIHLVHSAIFGVIFAMLLSIDTLRDVLDGGMKVTAAGIAYGLAVWVIAASIVMPLWVNAMMDMGESVPNFMPESAMGHAVFGAVLGITYYVLATE